MATPFVKMQGDGNDFVVLDETAERLVSDRSGFAARYCDRRFGVGADGVIHVERPEASALDAEGADVAMRLFQPDGDEAAMCGNGVRCVARFAVEEGLVEPGGPIHVRTPAGLRRARVDGDRVGVAMGTPSFAPGDVPATREIVEEALGELTVTAVDTGVPHAVAFVDDVETMPLERLAPATRHHDVFPEGANVDVAGSLDEDDGGGYRVRTFERGVEGETMACGTGAVAVAAVARRDRGAGDDVRIVANGGELRVTFDGDGAATLEGGAERVFEGSVPVEM
jgi:diaminopimelate epimerase